MVYGKEAYIIVKHNYFKGVIALSILALIGSLSWLFLEDQRVRRCSDNLLQTLTVEAGEGSVTAEDFLVDPAAGMTVSFVEFAADLTKVGVYPVTIVSDGYPFARNLEVVDTTAPTGEVRDVTFFLAPVPKVSDFLVSMSDISGCTAAFKSQPDLTVAGDQKVTLVLSDAYGNTAELTATLTVILDNEVPVITGVKAIDIYEGDAVAYRAGIEITDNMDEAPVLNVDSSQVDPTKPGTYPVIYSASDASGNVTVLETTITVREKKSGYVDLDTINAMADELLAKIVDDSMTKEQQVRAIYKWIRRNLNYTGSSDKSDWYQGAYRAMTRRGGDCFNYFALTKLFLQRLGIDNIDVKKVKNHARDSGHYWSLVSLDGGETWYHLDTTPRVGEGDNFCLVTDAFMDAYSNAHGKCFNRDKSLYPATPES